MFTTGSKLYFGLAALAAAALGVLGWATGWQMQATARRRVGAHRLRLPGRPDALHPGRRDRPGGRRRDSRPRRRPATRPGPSPPGFGARARRHRDGARHPPVHRRAGHRRALRRGVGGPVLGRPRQHGPRLQRPRPRPPDAPAGVPRRRPALRRAHRVRLLPGDGRPLQERRHRRVRRRRRASSWASPSCWAPARRCRGPSSVGSSASPPSSPWWPAWPGSGRGSGPSTRTRAPATSGRSARSPSRPSRAWPVASASTARPSIRTPSSRAATRCSR